MPAGDAGREQQPVDTAAIRQRLAEVSQRMQEHGHAVYVDGPVPLAEAVVDVAKTVPLLLDEVDRLRAQLAVQQAVVDAARWIEEDGWTPATRGALMEALRQLPADTAQDAQPESKRA